MRSQCPQNVFDLAFDEALKTHTRIQFDAVRYLGISARRLVSFVPSARTSDIRLQICLAADHWDAAVRPFGRADPAIRGNVKRETSTTTDDESGLRHEASLAVRRCGRSEGRRAVVFRIGRRLIVESPAGI